METPTKLERFVDASNNGAFTMDEELQNTTSFQKANMPELIKLHHKALKQD